jgi:hypothetical protein
MLPDETLLQHVPTEASTTPQHQPCHDPLAFPNGQYPQAYRSNSVKIKPLQHSRTQSGSAYMHHVKRRRLGEMIFGDPSSIRTEGCSVFLNIQHALLASTINSLLFPPLHSFRFLPFYCHRLALLQPKS